MNLNNKLTSRDIEAIDKLTDICLATYEMTPEHEKWFDKIHEHRMCFKNSPMDNRQRARLRILKRKYLKKTCK